MDREAKGEGKPNTDQYHFPVYFILKRQETEYKLNGRTGHENVLTSNFEAIVAMQPNLSS